uniref:DBR1 domain-containing protein n=1 Tax=Heterorhabditis bacteriophora TaxID=37862 RepID=A0A1I7XDN3_HETBA
MPSTSLPLPQNDSRESFPVTLKNPNISNENKSSGRNDEQKEDWIMDPTWTTEYNVNYVCDDTNLNIAPCEHFRNLSDIRNRRYSGTNPQRNLRLHLPRFPLLGTLYEEDSIDLIYSDDSIDKEGQESANNRFATVQH